MPLNVFRLYSALPGGSKPGFPIVTSISANCIHCSYGISQQSADWWSLFIFRLFRVTSLFAIYLFVRYCRFIFPHFVSLYFYAFLRFYSIIFQPVFLSRSFPLSLIGRIVFISYHSLAIIDVAGFTLVTSPISVAPFFPEAPRACYYIFELVVARYRSAVRITSGEWRDSKTRGA